MPILTLQIHALLCRRVPIPTSKFLLFVDKDDNNKNDAEKDKQDKNMQTPSSNVDDDTQKEGWLLVKPPPPSPRVVLLVAPELVLFSLRRVFLSLILCTPYT
jgi:hypothetical protein